MSFSKKKVNYLVNDLYSNLRTKSGQSLISFFFSLVISSIDRDVESAFFMQKCFLFLSLAEFYINLMLH